MSKTLGKRKEREEGATSKQIHSSTLFVSNLPYSATSTDLNTLFSDIGPVRSAFVVLEHETGSSKGVGYVSFAIREDAQAAYDKVNESGEGISLDGRRLRVQWAETKPHKDREGGPPHDASPKKEPKPSPRIRAPQSTNSQDPLAIRTIVISGLPPSIDSKALWKKVRKYEGADKVEWPAKIKEKEDTSIANVLFSSPAAAQEAVAKLHAHVFKGALLSVTLKKRLDGLAKPVKAVSEGKVTTKIKEAPAPSRANRLIVRNLPFDITEQDLRAVFLPYGPVHAIDIPKKEPRPKGEAPSEQAKQQGKGYAFVWMLSKKDAEKALDGANGKKVHAGMADGLVRDKQKKKKLRREEAKLRQCERARSSRQHTQTAEEEEDGGSGKEEGDENQDDDKDHEDFGAGDRVIAVDWALSKDRWQEAQAKLQEDDDGNEQDNAEVNSDSDDGHIGVHDHSDASSGSESEEEMDLGEDPPAGRPQLPPPETGTTLFVRNVPFEATEDELRTLFRAFGPLRYARITLDHETGRSRGTGFACFWNKEDADKVIEQSDILRQETTGGAAPTPKKNPFKLPSLLTPDPSSSVAQSLVLQGRTLDIVRAVTRDEAGKLKEEGERQREKADKRNLYLLREGIVSPNTPAAEHLPSAEVEKRTLSFNSRKALLRSNPSLYVSRTRLSIRQLPLAVTERMLKRLAIHAVRQFEAEVKAGRRPALTEDELADPKFDPDADEAKDSTLQGKGKAKDQKHKGRSTGVKQAKIIRQQDRVDAITGKGRSRGYGFLEMETHADALRVLRWSNNNPDVGNLFDGWWKEELEELVKLEKKKEKKEEGRLERLDRQLQSGSEKKPRGTLIVEFSIENVQVVRRRAAHQEEERSAAPVDKARRRGPPASSVKSEEEDAPKRKKQRPSESEGTATDEKPANKLGSLIGRKRKERKGKRKV